MAGLSLREKFLNLTTFREELSDLQKQSAWDDTDTEPLPVRIVMSQKGQPLAAVMPYRGYELLREMIFLLNARTSSQFGKELSVPGPTTDDVIETLKKTAGPGAAKKPAGTRTRLAR